MLSVRFKKKPESLNKHHKNVGVVFVSPSFLPNAVQLRGRIADGFEIVHNF
jgi:hypothetical protein